jgi:YHS domain-containing protein
MNRRSFTGVLIWLVTVVAFGSGAIAGNAERRLAIKGYDPVAYFTEKRPRIGDSRFEYKWDGAVYRFASRRHFNLFKADPDRYLPVFRGLCTAALSSGAKVVADPRNWLIYKGRLHIFGSRSAPDRMRRDPAGMKARAERNWEKLGRPRAEGKE